MAQTSSRRTSRVGRPSKYDPTFCRRLLAFFSRPMYAQFENIRLANDPPLLVDFARSIKCSLSVLYDWEKRYPEFHEAFEEARALIEKYWITCGGLGLTNSAITALVLKNNHGYREKSPEEAAPANVNINVHLTMIEGMKQVVAHRASRMQPAPSEANGHAGA